MSNRYYFGKLKMRFLGRIIIALLIGAGLCYAQKVEAQDYHGKKDDTFRGTKRSLEEEFDMLVQELFPVPDEDFNYEDIYESLFQLFMQPIDLNKADRNDLQELFILTKRQVNSFFDYREKHGKLLSIYELQAIPEWDYITIQRLLNFVKVRQSDFAEDNRSLFKRIVEEKNRYIMTRYSRVLEPRRGYLIQEGDTTASGAERSRYLGSPDGIYTRIRTSHVNDFSLGITVEKDPGEQIIWDPDTYRYGMDFISAHAVFYNKGKFKSIAIGDYQIQIGQGLLLAGGFAVGKGGETINTVRRSTTGIRPYTSVLETNFLRGGAATYELNKNIDITAFVSRVREDANIRQRLDTLADGFEEFASSIIPTGFHRTQNEINNKNQLLRHDAGAHIMWHTDNNRSEIGLTFIGSRYSTPLQRNPNKYNQFEFRGTENYNIGLHFNHTWRNINFFGEAARSKSGGIGAVGGLIAALARELEMSLLFRRYDRNFHSFYGNPFAEGTRPINENGIYWGIKYSPTRRLIFSAYFDRFSFPWLRFLVDAPSAGYEYLARVTYRPSRKVRMFAQMREEVRERNWRPDEGQPMNSVIPYRRRNYQMVASFQAERIISLQSRFQFSSYQIAGVTTRGYAIAQDANFDFNKFRLSTRFALFQTDDFENRQYVYERDVLYYFFIPALNGEGFRNFYMIQFRPTRTIDIWIKYAFTYYLRQDTIGSGLDLIEGNRRTDVRAQVRYKF
ncbi:MAG: helix-hairpin-helix domain-containing protein [Bernardetiaceae bacterium]|nr:helix-hairpin-helix domain-containing protein [Bernardetiaceae bacterium]